MDPRVKEIMSEKTLVLIKPDAAKRGLIGEVISRLERVGLKMVACKLIVPSTELLDGHFPKSESWIRGMGQKTVESYAEQGLNVKEHLGVDDPLEIGQMIKRWNYLYLKSGALMAIILEGPQCVKTVRKIVGHTLPCKADPGTIRGDYSINAPDIANVVGSACKNLIHASGTKDEASKEINNWFQPNEICKWERDDTFFHFIHGENTLPIKPEGDVVMSSNLKEEVSKMENNDEARQAAEYAYAVAMIAKASGNNDEAQEYGRKAIVLLDKVSTDSLADCAARNNQIGSIVIPDIFHQDVVRSRLGSITL